MSNERIGKYEGMFLFPQNATANLQGAVDHLKDILEKSNATILTLRKWDDRRLAYEISGNKRGVYFLVYFTAPTSQLSDLERRCNQSEDILRMMVTKADHLSQEIIEANDGEEDLATEIKLRKSETKEDTKEKTGSISHKGNEKSKAEGDTKGKTEEVAEKPTEEVDTVEPDSGENAEEPTEEVDTVEPDSGENAAEDQDKDE